MCKIFLLPFILLPLHLFSHNSVILYPVLDNTLYQDSSGVLSNGSGTGIFIGTTYENEIRRAVLKFDVAAGLPANAVITNVSLVLTLNQTISGSANASVHFLNSEWGEGGSVGSGSGAYAQTNDATWLHRFYPSVFWNSPGGDFIQAPSASITVIGTGSYTWSGQQMISDVQSWLNNPSLNAGWIIIGDETTYPTAKRFASKENANISTRPKLIIDYYIGCHNPDVPVLSVSDTNVCPFEEVVINVSGDLHSAEEWKLYTGSCGSVLSDSSGGGSFIIHPAATTTYYIRGEGGCVNPGACALVTIMVKPQDDASFMYNSVLFCRNETDPVPALSGNGGGSFSSSPGLQIDNVTGEVDLSASNPGNYSVQYLTDGECPDTTVQVITILPDYNMQEYRTICLGEELEFGSQTIFIDGVYTESFNTMNGCDSVVTLHLSTKIFQKEVSQDGNFLTVADDAENYQWINCDDFSPVNGATGPSFEGIANNSYAVILSEDLCADTTECYTILSLIENIDKDFRIFPNPSGGEIVIEINDPLHTEIRIVDVTGKEVSFTSVKQKNGIFVKINEPAYSVYIIRIKSGDKTYTEKLWVTQ